MQFQPDLSALLDHFKLPTSPAAIGSWLLAASLAFFPRLAGSGLGQENSPPPNAADSQLPELALSTFRPRPELKVPETLLTRAKFPVVDVHSHFFVRARHDPQQLKAYVDLMDRNHIAVSVSLDGTLGPRLEAHRTYLWTEYRDRFLIFANIDWEHGFAAPGLGGPAHSPASAEPGFVEKVIAELRLAKEQGISGLKIFKQFGLEHRDAAGELLRIDDPRWDPIWEACGRLGLPVLMHTADPSAFFRAADPTNERFEEIARHPEWSFAGPGLPTRQELHDARNRVIARHPRTIFIAAHLGNDGEDLQQTAAWLERYPNLYVEIASRISELGRQPYSARRFFKAYRQRILFGTDGPWPELRLQRYWRFLETDDEYFAYSEKDFPPQGFWNIYGLYLPDDILQDIYHRNACRIIPHLRERLERQGHLASERQP
jgi:predicted TIM-barrel fold metal-dependent hydrolase